MKRRAIFWVILTLLMASPCWATEPPPAIWTAQAAVAFARQNNPDTLMARQRILEAKALVQRATVGFYPQLELNAGYTQTNNPMYSFGNILNQGAFSSAINFNDPGRTDNLELGLGVQYRIYNGGQDRAGQQAAVAGVEASSAAQQATGLQLEFMAVQGFQRIVEAENLVKARQSALESIKAALHVAQARFAAGDLLKLDLLNLEVQESRAQENLIQAQHNLKLSHKVFLTLLGLPGAEVRIDSQAAALPAVPPQVDATHRPELQGLMAALKARESQLQAARGSRLPTVDGFVNYQYDQGSVTGGDGDSWLAGLKVNFKLFDGHRASADIARADAQLGVLRAALQKLKLALGLEITRAQLALDQSHQRLQVTEKMLELATESEQLSQAQFREGVILASDLIDSENRLTDARLRNVLASSARRIAIADLRRAVGLPQFDSSSNLISRVENQP